MANTSLNKSPLGPRLGSALALFAVALPACSGKPAPAPGQPAGPFSAVEATVNAPGSFTQPRAGVPLPDGSIAFLAMVEGLPETETKVSGQRVAVFKQTKGGAPAVLYQGDKLVNPLDIDASLDGMTLYIADPSAGAEGTGAILTLASAGGEPAELISGWAPRGVTVSASGAVYFSGIDQDSGEPGVFIAAAGTASPVFVGAPLTDPSGIAVLENAGVLVADTSLFDRKPEGAPRPDNEAGVVQISDGKASVFATGFATGYPAGIALTTDEKTLIISGEGPDRSDSVYLVDMANPKATPTIVTSSFSAFQDSSAGLKRAHDSNTFIWASLSANGGTVYTIRGQ